MVEDKRGVDFYAKIGVVSDTHSKSLPLQMLRDFQEVDFIIHAGDFADMSVWEELSKIHKVEGVCGNMDGAVVCERLPQKQIIACGPYHIGLTHGGGSPKKLLEKVKKVFEKDRVDVIVFGHSHHPLNETIDGVLYFNPGSPTDEIFAPFRSYGILELSETGIQGRIIEVKDEE